MSVGRLLGALMGCLLLFTPVYADYPNKAVKIVVPFEPGGAVDLIARILADRIAGPLGQSVIVENRGGAGSIVGTEFASRAEPDGYTLLMGSASGFMITPLLRELSYKPLEDFVPVALVGQVPFLVVSSASLPPTSLKEFLDYAKQHPGELAYASAGAGTPHHVAGEMFAQATGLKLMHVPYKGTAPGLFDVIGGRVAIMNSEILAALPHVRAGKLRALGIAAESRSSLAPEIPTLKEVGLPDFHVITWYGLMAPAGVPDEVVTKLSNAVAQALKEPEMRQKLEENGVIPGKLAGPEFKDFLLNESVKWTKAVKDTGVRLE